MLTILALPVAAQTQSLQTWPEVDTYVQLNSNVRVSFFAAATRENRQGTSAELGPNIDFFSKPLEKITIFELDPSKSRVFSPGLMFAGLVLLSVGCILRVSGEVLAYQEIVRAAWVWLPYSAILELFAVSVFTTNLFLTFMRNPVTPQSTIAQIRSPRAVVANTQDNQ